MKRFISINEEFICQNCGTRNLPLKGGCRNHCHACLYSMHLDQNNPGDRQSECYALMSPEKIEHNGKKGWMIIHKCLKCDKTIKNKSAEDDNFDLIINLSRNN